MCSLFQIKLIRNPFIIWQRQHIPVIVIFKRYNWYFLKRYFSINVKASTWHASTRIILPAFDRNVIISILRHFNVPFNPLSCRIPCVSAAIIQNSFGHTVGYGCRRGSVIFCIKRRLRSKCCSFTLNNLNIIFGLFSCLIMFLTVLCVIIQLNSRSQLDLPNHHRFIDRFQGQSVLTFFKIKLIRLRLIPHVIPAECRLPLIFLYLRRSDFIALVIYSDISAILPKTSEGNVCCILKRKLSIHIQLSLNCHASGFYRHVLKTHLI